MEDRDSVNKVEVFNTTDENKEPDTDQKTNDINYLKEITHMVIYFIAVICTVLFIHHFIGQQIEVSGSSMESTLHNNDHLILEKMTYHFNSPERFDIVVFQPYKNNSDVYYIKRVIGLPGETIQIIGSDIYIDGELLEEDYGKDAITDGGIAKEGIVLGEDEYFLLGDNRNNSKDSRDSSIGVVNRSAIIGRAWVRLWPLKSIGVLEHQ